MLKLCLNLLFLTAQLSGCKESPDQQFCIQKDKNLRRNQKYVSNTILKTNNEGAISEIMRKDTLLDGSNASNTTVEHSHSSFNQSHKFQAKNPDICKTKSRGHQIWPYIISLRQDLSNFKPRFFFRIGNFFTIQRNSNRQKKKIKDLLLHNNKNFIKDLKNLERSLQIVEKHQKTNKNVYFDWKRRFKRFINSSNAGHCKESKDINLHNTNLNSSHKRRTTSDLEQGENIEEISGSSQRKKISPALKTNVHEYEPISDIVYQENHLVPKSKNNTSFKSKSLFLDEVNSIDQSKHESSEPQAIPLNHDYTQNSKYNIPKKAKHLNSASITTDSSKIELESDDLKETDCLLVTKIDSSEENSYVPHQKRKNKVKVEITKNFEDFLCLQLPLSTHYQDKLRERIKDVSKDGVTIFSDDRMKEKKNLSKKGPKEYISEGYQISTDPFLHNEQETLELDTLELRNMSERPLADKQKSVQLDSKQNKKKFSQNNSLDGKFLNLRDLDSTHCLSRNQPYEKRHRNKNREIQDDFIENNADQNHQKHSTNSTSWKYSGVCDSDSNSSSNILSDTSYDGKIPKGMEKPQHSNENCAENFNLIKNSCLNNLYNDNKIESLSNQHSEDILKPQEPESKAHEKANVLDTQSSDKGNKLFDDDHCYSQEYLDSQFVKKEGDTCLTLQKQFIKNANKLRSYISEYYCDERIPLYNYKYITQNNFDCTQYSDQDKYDASQVIHRKESSQIDPGQALVSSLNGNAEQKTRIYNLDLNQNIEKNESNATFTESNQNKSSSRPLEGHNIQRNAILTERNHENFTESKNEQFDAFSDCEQKRSLVNLGGEKNMQNEEQPNQIKKKSFEVKFSDIFDKETSLKKNKGASLPFSHQRKIIASQAPSSNSFSFKDMEKRKSERKSYKKFQDCQFLPSLNPKPRKKLKDFFTEKARKHNFLLSRNQKHVKEHILHRRARILQGLIEQKRQGLAQDKKNPLNPKMSSPKCVSNRIIMPDGSDGGSCYTHGAVTTEVPACSEIGNKILKRGGNAVDAAIASTICVGIINSFSSGIGGGGFMLIQIPDLNGPAKADSFDFRETAPKKIETKLFQKSPEASKVGGLAVGVPGEIRGLYDAHQKYGKLPWKDLFTDSIELSKSFEVTEQLYKRLLKLESYIFADPGLKEVYTKDNKLVAIGSKISREKYSKTLYDISQDPTSFYNGKIAQKIIQSVNKAGGVITLEDLSSYQSIRRETISSTFRGYNVVTMNIPTSGPFILEALNIMEHFDLKELARVGQTNSQKPEFPHYQLLVEIFKFIGAGRGKMADPAFLKGAKTVVEEVIDPKFADGIAKRIDLNHTLPNTKYGFEGSLPEDHGTTHINVIDENDMVVSITSTINLEFGAKFMCTETGIIFNNQMDDFYIPDMKNAFNLPQMAKNIIEPGKKPFSSACPLIIFKENEKIILGAAGGTRIPTSVLTVIFHLILGKSIEEAIDAPRIHNQFLPDTTYIENTFEKDISDYLQAKGHKIELSATNSIFTSVQGIHVIQTRNSDRIIQAASDKRKGGIAAGY